LRGKEEFHSMIRLTIAALVCMLLMLGSTRAQDAPFVPKSPPPSFGFVHALDTEKGLIKVLYVVAKPVHVTLYKEETRETEGKVVAVKVPYTETKMVMEVALKEWAPMSGKATDGSGKVLGEAEVWKRLKKGDAVLLMQGDTIDPAFLKVIQPEAVVLYSPPPAPGAAVPAPAPPAKKKELSELEEQVLELINAERKQAGVAALTPQALLMKAARDHSANMASQQMLAHELDGKGPNERVRDLGYKSLGAAENCAAGQRTPAQVMHSWMNSQGHRGNILGKDTTEIGIGMALSAGGTPYWTLVFATPTR
jgi:uncharacterized protein YkwD